MPARKYLHLQAGVFTGTSNPVTDEMKAGSTSLRSLTVTVRTKSSVPSAFVAL